MTPRASFVRPADAARALGISTYSVLYRARYGKLRAAWITPGLVRIYNADLLVGVPPWPAHLPAVLSAQQVADLLALHQRTVRRLAAQGVIPGRIRQGQWCFNARVLREWVERLSNQNLHAVA